MIYFENDKPVAVEWPPGYGDGEASEAHKIRLETIHRALIGLAAGGTAKKIGQKVILLAYLAEGQPFTHETLARRLGVSRSRVTQILTDLRPLFAALQNTCANDGEEN